MKWWIFLVMVFALNANPVAVEFINEFQVAPFDSERVELRFLVSSTWDTVFTDTFPLHNTTISTPAGIANIDTNILLIGNGQAVIDRSVLTGSFELPDDSGYISLTDYYDSLNYPGPVTMWQHAPVPPGFSSAAKFHCYIFSGWDYSLMIDWYIDPTPTFGAPNDDYPGCLVSGIVYDNQSQPLPGARVTATISQYASGTFPPLDYYTCCTTFTALDGSYHLDSLLPSYYNIDVNATGYLPDTQSVGRLCCMDPITGLNFYLPTGIAENQEHGVLSASFVQPNPFRNAFHISMVVPVRHIEIYDITGKLLRWINNANMSTDMSVDCADLPRGIYFVALREQKLKVIKF
jgi:hypothetical protein